MPTNLGKNPLDEFEPTDPPQLQDKLLAPLTFDRDTLLIMAHQQENTQLAVTLIVFTALLDLTGIRGFNLRFSLRFDGQLTLLHLLTQPLLLLYVAWLIRYGLSILGSDMEVIQVYRLLGFAQLWTVISWLVALLLARFQIESAVVDVVLFLVFGSAYFSVIIRGLTTARGFGDTVTVLTIIVLLVSIGLFLPALLLGASPL